MGGSVAKFLVFFQHNFTPGRAISRRNSEPGSAPARPSEGTIQVHGKKCATASRGKGSLGDRGSKTPGQGGCSCPGGGGRRRHNNVLGVGERSQEDGRRVRAHRSSGVGRSVRRYRYQECSLG